MTPRHRELHVPSFLLPTGTNAYRPSPTGDRLTGCTYNERCQVHTHLRVIPSTAAGSSYRGGVFFYLQAARRPLTFTIPATPLSEMETRSGGLFVGLPQQRGAEGEANGECVYLCILFFSSAWPRDFRCILILAFWQRVVPLLYLATKKRCHLQATVDYEWFLLPTYIWYIWYGFGSEVIGTETGAPYTTLLRGVGRRVEDEFRLKHVDDAGCCYLFLRVEVELRVCDTRDDDVRYTVVLHDVVRILSTGPVDRAAALKSPLRFVILTLPGPASLL